MKRMNVSINTHIPQCQCFKNVSKSHTFGITTKYKAYGMCLSVDTHQIKTISTREYDQSIFSLQTYARYIL